MFLPFSPSPKLVLLGIGLVAFVLLGAAVAIQTARVDSLTVQRDAAVRLADENAKAALALEEHARRTEKALMEEREAYARRLRSLESARNEVNRAEDGPVAPALRRALDGVRVRPNAD